jgi:hypothetical protein
VAMMCPALPQTTIAMAAIAPQWESWPQAAWTWLATHLGDSQDGHDLGEGQRLHGLTGAAGGVAAAAVAVPWATAAAV